VAVFFVRGVRTDTIYFLVRRLGKRSVIAVKRCFLQNHPKDCPTLTRSYKKAYPFKLATTSFIYPDHYVPNVNLLGPYFDEIELLLFESLPPGAMPDSAIIGQLGELAGKYELTYNVHLPIDISITDPDPLKQRRAVDTILSIIDLTTGLSPSGYVLHLPYPADTFETRMVKKWQNQALAGLRKIMAAGIPPESILIETLDYPCELLTPIVWELDLSICLDLGHLMLQGYDIKNTFHNYGAKTAMIHLHGFSDGRDHLGLNTLSDRQIGPLLWILSQFTQTVSLEVFSLEQLQASLAFMDKHWK
jgi:sugar phosphate isomerase/epimerase